MRALPVTTEGIRGQRLRYSVGGIVLAVLGIAAIAAPAYTSEAIGRVIGWLLLAGGGVTTAMTLLSKREGWSAWLSLGGSLAAAVAGALLLWSPAGGQETLSSILVAFFAASGAAKIGVAIMQRATIPGLWNWLFASGLIDVAMSLTIIVRWPFQVGWFLGLMMGISLLGSGVLIVLIAMSRDRDPHSAQT